jgi:hypothetical protein
MIYDGLLSRTRLRERMAERSQFDVGFPSQVRIWLELYRILC